MVATGTRPAARLVGLVAAAARRRLGRGRWGRWRWRWLYGSSRCRRRRGRGKSGRRLALVVGNDAYTDQSVLWNAVNAARALASALGEVGFAVTWVENADRARLTSALSAFARSPRATT